MKKEQESDKKKSTGVLKLTKEKKGRKNACGNVGYTAIDNEQADKLPGKDKCS